MTLAVEIVNGAVKTAVMDVVTRVTDVINKPRACVSVMGRKQK